MKVIFVLAAWVLCIGIAQAGGSFRLANGKLLEEGQTVSEVIALAGKPLHKDVLRGHHRHSATTEKLSFELDGSIGGKYLVVVTVQGGIVQSVSAKQLDRL